jgi:photosystem II stability/assembly factor-like uncharacterized protein
MKKLLIALLLSQSLTAQVIPADMLSQFSYRNIGPFRTGGWITGFAVPEKPLYDHLYTFYVGTRNGGLWKTNNNGSSFENIFPYHHTIGAIAVAPSDNNIVWTGTGESYVARSTYSGDGIYKSSDAGKTWQHMGLKETQHIVRIIIHPQQPDVVYVASPGHLFTPNAERGVFKTTDGGKHWQKIFFIDDNTGAIDLVMHPSNPDILYAASYEKYRSAWTMESGGTKSALYKTTDGGKNWKKLSGGLPSGVIGRIGIGICREKPSTVYAVVENLNLRDSGATTTPARTIAGEVYRSDDDGATWKKMNRADDNVGGKAAYSFNQITVHPTDADKLYITGSDMACSADGGKTWTGIGAGGRGFFPGSFGDVRTFWIDHQQPARMLFGSDGGIHISYDAGKTCDFYDNVPLGEIYGLDVDMNDPYNVYAGLQDHDSWKGPSNGWSGTITLENWVTVGSDDGMYNVVDPVDGRWVYNTGQFGIHRRVDQQMGIRVNIEPKPKTGEAPYRYNWCTPLHLSPHDPAVIYTGSQYLLRSRDRGDSWETISPDLTTNNPKRINGKGGVQYCTITSITESPKQRGLIWVGTDDGKTWVTQDSGRNWKDMTAAIDKAGGPAGKWVSRVAVSLSNAAVAYVTKTGFREDDFKPYLFKTTDYGNTWKMITNGLPDQPLNVIVEDPVNPRLLFAGNDAGVYVSISGGEQWQPLKANMPIVPVHDLKIHPREKDLIAGTYGRGVWIADISFLEDVNPTMLNSNAFLFNVEEKYFRVPRVFGGNYQLYGTRHIKAPNEPNGLVINYYLKSDQDSASINIQDNSGKTVYQNKATGKKGLNSITWNFGAGGRRAYTSMPDLTLPPGELTVTLQLQGEKFVRKTKFKGVKGWPVN